MSDKLRLDLAIAELGLAPSRSHAQALVIAGQVLVDGQQVDKPSQMVTLEQEFSIKEQPKYVSRGGLKLEKAVEEFALDIDGKVCMDVGASTGGFTDVMLQNGAKKVYAVDVGHGQLHYALRQNDKVVVMERYNARNLTPDDFDELAGFGAVDVSFISLQLILLPLFRCLSDGAHAVALIKPQFEAGRKEVGKRGVVSDDGVRMRVCQQIMSFAYGAGYGVNGLIPSPILGPKGNAEYLLHIMKADGQYQPEQFADLAKNAVKILTLGAQQTDDGV
ncbi:TlyA family RNA methyltransferase [Eubacteriales bacterium OttesenSCG-928-N14]|nr:TlyA family RNA methyltransferase [Eubacteriales bacterium OttesenSCG-928-N14]